MRRGMAFTAGVMLIGGGRSMALRSLPFAAVLGGVGSVL